MPSRTGSPDVASTNWALYIILFVLFLVVASVLFVRQSYVRPGNVAGRAAQTAAATAARATSA